MKAERTGSRDEAGMPADALEVGRVLDAWGLKGWLKIQPFSADPEALLAAKRWHISPPGGSVALLRPGATYPAFLDVGEARMHGEGVVALVTGVADRNAAEALRGARIFLSRSSFPAAGIDEFYWVDLIGLEVFNRAGHCFGRVVGLLDNGPQSVLRVLPGAALPTVAAPAAAVPATAVPAAEPAPFEERLIPFVSAYVDEVDLASRRITVDWGLDY